MKSATTIIAMILFISLGETSSAQIKQQKGHQNVLFSRSFVNSAFKGDAATVSTVATGDSFRGWDWNGSKATYVAKMDGKYWLYSAPFDGTRFTGPSTKLSMMASGDAIRGWNWDGKNATYVALKDGKYWLFLRAFDGTTFSGGTTTVSMMASGDYIRGWDWDGTNASYIAFKDGKYWLFSRPFDGTKFVGDVSKISMMSSGDNIRAWTTHNSTGMYIASVFRPDLVFDADITQEQRRRLTERHNFALDRIAFCSALTAQEKARLHDAYRKRIRHSSTTISGINGQATLNGNRIWINFGVLFPQGDREIAQTLIHETMHLAGFSHPKRQASDTPGDNGPYFSTAALRAEICVAGKQSDKTCVSENGRCTIRH